MFKWLPENSMPEETSVFCKECCKVLYTRKAAGYLVNEMHGKHGLRRHHGKVPVRLYPCFYKAGFYHVTSKHFNSEDPILRVNKKEL